MEPIGFLWLTKGNYPQTLNLPDLMQGTLHMKDQISAVICIFWIIRELLN